MRRFIKPLGGLSKRADAADDDEAVDDDEEKAGTPIIQKIFPGCHTNEAGADVQVGHKAKGTEKKILIILDHKKKD